MISASAISKMIGICYDRANSPRYKREKWLEIADMLETCHRISLRGSRKMPNSIDKWLRGLAGHLGVPLNG